MIKKRAYFNELTVIVSAKAAVATVLCRSYLILDKSSGKLERSANYSNIPAINMSTHFMQFCVMHHCLPRATLTQFMSPKHTAAMHTEVYLTA